MSFEIFNLLHCEGHVLVCHVSLNFSLVALLGQVCNLYVQEVHFPTHFVLRQFKSSDVVSVLGDLYVHLIVQGDFKHLYLFEGLVYGFLDSTYCGHLCVDTLSELSDFILYL